MNLTPRTVRILALTILALVSFLGASTLTDVVWRHAP